MEKAQKQVIMKKKNIISRNYLEGIPLKNEALGWSTDDEGIVTLEIENTGFFNRIAQRFFKKPRISYVHLDEMGSFVWPLTDGNKNLIEIGEFVKDRFGEKAEPLYERLAKYFQILESYNFIKWK